jgi:alanine racemase
MPEYSIREISSIVHGNVSGDADFQVAHILTDSRKILDPGSSLFIALNGEKRDGHHFITEALLRGVRGFLVTQIPPDLLQQDLSPGSDQIVFVVVKDTLSALHQLAAHHRAQFNYPVIGLTGSNGKTIVKEWLNYLMQDERRIIRSPKSYNSQVGVPLSVWQMHQAADVAIFEAGISTKGEMEKLEKMIRPDIGIFTNIGEAHSEGFSSRREKIREKLNLFVNSKWLIYCRDYTDLHEEVQLLAKEHSVELLDWSNHGVGSFQVVNKEQHQSSTFIRIRYQQKEVCFSIPYIAAAPVENAITCAVTMIHLGLEYKLKEKMEMLPSLSMRLEMKNGINRCTVINDSYSTDISSLKLALDFLQQQQQHSRRTVILSDIPQSGKQEDELYREVIIMLSQHRITSLKGVGPVISSYAGDFRKAGIDAEFWLTTEDFVHHFNPLTYKDETILIKGARSFGFEQVNQLLEMKVHQTVLTVDLKALSENLTLYRKMLNRGTKIMVMVKAFSYGSGSYEIANLMQFHKVDYLAVAYADEGVELRKAGISVPIMVMNPDRSSFSSLVNYDLQPEIFSFDILGQFSDFLKQEGINEFPVHIKLDTGMHRLGFESEETGKLGQFLLEKQRLRVITVFTHLAGSEDPADDDYTSLQATRFRKACDDLEEALRYNFTRHISNTAAILRHPSLQMDMVRLGIGLYGVNIAANHPLNLKNVASLTTTIAQIRPVKAGETVGYNRKGRLSRDSLIATIRIGYADGYPRSLGNGQGKVMIRNRLFPVVGSVCMDMTMVDITEGPEVGLNDEVVIFGRGLPLVEVAEWAGTITYDIMTGISQRVRRVYVED